MNNINLIYSGGSGGFFALWILLLATPFRCKFKYRHDNDNLSLLFKYQWKNIDKSKWKKSEVWPDNCATLKSNIDKKILYFCNEHPDNSNLQGIDKNKNIVIYTDYATQLEIFELKKCFQWYTWQKTSKEEFFLKTIIQNYNNLKAEHWPNVENFSDLLNLNEKIKLELINEFGWKKIGNELKQTYINHTSTLYNNDLIPDYVYDEYICKSDLQIKWQDIIRTNGKCLLNPLGYDTNQSVIDFIEYYLNLHPKDFIQNHILNN